MDRLITALLSHEFVNVSVSTCGIVWSGRFRLTHTSEFADGFELEGDNNDTLWISTVLSEIIKDDEESIVLRSNNTMLTITL